jgi:type I restriction enzyme S subunit
MGNFQLTVGDISDIFDGPHATPTKTHAGPFFLSISSLSNGRLDLSKSAHISEKDFKTWTKRVTPQKGDLLFSYETRLGEAALMPDHVRACLGRRMGLLRANPKKITPEYLLYAYLSPEFQQTIAANTITGATVDRISLTDFRDFPIRIPELEEQRKVSGLLKDIDAKIDCNNRINTELNLMIRTLFNYWFVQFDFPDTTGKPYKSSGGKMIYNAILKRDIPAGWSSATLASITPTSNDSVTPANFPDKQFKHFSIPVFDKTKTYGIETGKSIGRADSKVKCNTCKPVRSADAKHSQTVPATSA